MFFFHKLREAEAAEDIRRPDDDATVDAFVIFVTRLGSLSSGSTKAHFRILHIKFMYLAGMTGTTEIVFAPYDLSHPYYIYFYNLVKTFTRVNIEGFEEFEEGATVLIFPHYVETMKFM
ncbi:hypothetical protein HID58_001214 [Brassica napus]|uniref:F-box associated beta-propeller type 3 domain-containing protein n=1 Tax=Brassica napus TaxID=3708 RepID=A0ABQ8EIQ9_BRANA|nr:hypothetical protein HID58_001214 [Brassica napus]